MNILVIEDEKEIRESVCRLLQQEKYAVASAEDGLMGLDMIWGESYDLILLDIMLPRKDGLELLAEVRDEGITTPILMLTAKGDVEDKIRGLDLGADDYLGKPFSPAELLARVRALLRRRSNVNPQIEVGDLVFDTNSREVFSAGRRVELTGKEYSLLEILLYNRGRAVSRFSLAEHVWGDDFDPFSMSNFIDVHIKNLRKKIMVNGEQPIKTVRGFGYKFEGE